jgi:hypothetical protein
MIASFTTTYQNTSPRKPDSRSNSSSGLSQVFAAAVVNQQFRDMLLHDPCIALQKGSLGETFSLSEEEQDLITSIRAQSLSDLAKQINHSLLGNY